MKALFLLPKAQNIIKLVFFLFLISFVFVNPAFAENILIVANSSVPESSLTPMDIRNIFLGQKKTWSDNSKIGFFVLPGEYDLHKSFLRKYVNKSPTQFKNYWRQMLFSGKGREPRSFKTEKELINFVINNSGSIGYVSSSANTDSVKVISIK